MDKGASWNQGINVYSYDPGQMANRTTTLIFGKTIQVLLTGNRKIEASKFGISTGHSSSVKFARMKTLGLTVTFFMPVRFGSWSSYMRDFYGIRFQTSCKIW